MVRAVEIERMQQLFDALDLPLYTWSAAPKHRFVRIEPVDISGRRFTIVATAPDRRPPAVHAAPE